jgi:hypothetical protein
VNIHCRRRLACRDAIAILLLAQLEEFRQGTINRISEASDSGLSANHLQCLPEAEITSFGGCRFVLPISPFVEGGCRRALLEPLNPMLVWLQVGREPRASHYGETNHQSCLQTAKAGEETDVLHSDVRL